ncbi:tetratricopeptide repeat protein [Polaribacter porphyrae]|uniref:ATPase domain-containing protein n=1 Tax=Polaribacter porphyrae TaxID=1137780 RepID=A0A2S7WT60_9FLAO|nr:tetratricopeptide repeat protein [Polaribacter porphyrae]PQJ80754.1 hypothetical protein BTO18_16945 [Polaribacter porphyrae]
MDKEKYITLSQLGVYNPQRLDDDTVERLFVVRQKFFEFLIKKINKETPNSIPQHYLVIGQRGMGKSTLLKRIEVEFRKEASKFIPLLFPEEQYNLNKLSEFWLNSLDAMADALEVEQKTEEVKLIDSKIKELQTISDEDDLARSAYQFLIKMSQQLKLRPVLLIDNMNFVFDRLDKSEQHTLRSWLMENKAPIVVGASAVEIEETFNYEAPFYDAFQVSHLKKLTFQELIEVLNNLARLTNAKEVLDNIHDEIARLKTIHQLTGGNPRTAVMLFKIIVKGFSKEINDDLEALLDEITPLYKARFEELSTQLQIIVDAVALNWDPINLEQLRNETKLSNGQLSPQLKRLVELGWLEKLDAYKAKGNAYQISERFFNIWFLMRRSSRRQKKELYCLSKFLETFYGDDINDVAKKSISLKSKNVNQITYKLALAEVTTDEELKRKLYDSCDIDIREQAKTNPIVFEDFGKYITQISNKNKGNKISRIEEEYLEKIKNDAENYFNWFRLGYFYHEKGEIEKAKIAFIKSSELDNNIDATWNNLGIIYTNEGNGEKAKECLEKAININRNNGMTYINIGINYLYNLYEYAKAEKAFLKAIDLGTRTSSLFNVLGNLYQDYLREYSKSEKAYKIALQINDTEIYSVKYNLVFLYRDKMNKQKEAEELFSTLIINKDLKDSYWLNKSLFELYKKNQGTASEFLLKALNIINNKLPTNTQDDWFRFAGVTLKQGFGKWLLEILKENDFDIILAPYYVAIKAILEKDTEGYLNSKALEIREPAKKIVEIIQNSNI